MAALEKFGGIHTSCGVLRHVLREVKTPANEDIDPARTHLNYSLAPKRGMRPYSYLKKRLGELRCMNRADVNVMCGWTITKPKELPEREERRFFELCYRFLADRYGGEKNVIAAQVHKDESGEAHLHFCFVPVVGCYSENENMVKVVRYYEKHPGETNISKAARELGLSRKTVRRWRDKTAADLRTEKISAKEVLNREDLTAFHGDLQDFLDRNGIRADVNSGVTLEQGGNKMVAEMKRERLLSREIVRGQEVEQDEFNL